ncbi:MAG TPA: FAD-dependent oxidoreductase [Phycisphaerae bacterium]|nr:FAD-dependent oxidoreductase [Phycisphaerae bacterium]HUT60137.1 FAD-dependent oxidoreductase [Phycisphaerae bacterium]
MQRTGGTTAFRTVRHQADLCVIGGGMAGLCAAIAAARHGAKVVLMHDRPVLGGNASSEIRVHICGADRHNHIPNMRETGILEELRLQNLRRNPQRSFSVWDTILYETARAEQNLTLLLNCSCFDADMEGRPDMEGRAPSRPVEVPTERDPPGARIARVRGWQTTTQTVHEVAAGIFADCSGDAILAPLSGAEFRVGREARNEFGESHAPEVADDRTMGQTILFQARPHDSPQPFAPPAWAYRFEKCEDLPYGQDDHRWFQMGYWWVELGGAQDSIHDTEAIRDELLKICYGVWDHIKNRCPHRDEAANWAIDWIQFLPGKRESRRYIGDHVLTQNDIEAEGRFDNLVAYGGWTMDDHDPEGFWAVRSARPATIFHRSPSPYGIPYRSLYSRNVDNLMFAGRCASCTHMAMSSTRVMGTGCSMGQAVGTAAAMAVQKGVLPRGLLEWIGELQQALLRDDCYLPWTPQRFGPLTREAKLTASRGDPEPLRDGVNRPVGGDEHAWPCQAGDWVQYEFASPQEIERVSLILDSALHRNVQMSYHQPDDQLTAPPPELPRAFDIDVLAAGKWHPLAQITDNHRRLVRVTLGREVAGIRFTLRATWGAPPRVPRASAACPDRGEPSRVFAFYAD